MQVNHDSRQWIRHYDSTRRYEFEVEFVHYRNSFTRYIVLQSLKLGSHNNIISITTETI